MEQRLSPLIQKSYQELRKLFEDNLGVVSFEKFYEFEEQRLEFGLGTSASKVLGAWEDIGLLIIDYDKLRYIYPRYLPEDVWRDGPAYQRRVSGKVLRLLRLLSYPRTKQEMLEEFNLGVDQRYQIDMDTLNDMLELCRRSGLLVESTKKVFDV